MKVARKHILALIAGIVVVMATYAAWQIRHEVVLLEHDAEEERLLGQTMLLGIEQIWNAEGEGRAREVIALANRTVPQIGLRVVSLQAPAGDLQRPALSDIQVAALAHGDVVQVERQTATGEAWDYTYEPIVVAGQRRMALEVAESRQPELTYLRLSHWAIAAATLTVVLICGLLATGLDLYFIARPLQRLRDKLRRASDGDFSQPLLLNQHDEIGELAADVNAMCTRIADANRRLAEATDARIAALEQLRHTDRLATVGQLAAGVAHELGTPLNVVGARAQLIVGTEMARPDVVKNARVILEQSDRMTEIIHQLLDFSRRRGATPALVSIGPVVARTIDLLSALAERTHVQLQYEPPPGGLLARIDQNQIQQALANVILNGIQAMPHGGRLQVRVGPQAAHPPGQSAAPDHDYLCITVQDEGGGIAREQLSRIFEPFFTTKAVGEGTGLGLAVAHGIVAEHGGWIGVDSTLGAGSRFSIYLPLPVAAGSRSIEGAA